MFDDFVRTDTAPVYPSATATKPLFHLLWGDGVEILQSGSPRSKVRARGRDQELFIKNDALGGQSLLEVYFIDVGQGDGVLIKTPDFRHVMIDGGYNRAMHDVGKNAADFVDWKFFEDYAQDRITLDAMIASHNDLDHFGGLWDLLNVALIGELDCDDVRLNAFYHAGLAWWKKGDDRTLGTFVDADNGSFFTQLMGDRAAVSAALQPAAAKRLAGTWASLMQSVIDTRTAAGQPTPITRLSHLTGYLPGFAPAAGGGVGAAAAPTPTIKILGPVEFEIDGQPAIRRYGSAEGQNTNGNSVLMRLDYGRARILLTGDLNKNSQRSLLADYTGERQEFQCDVAKACHHGSSDVSYEFLQAMHPAVTVISSGDNEGHDHPRPTIIAASATSGYLELANDELVSPLIYATEIARSVLIGRPNQLVVAGEDDDDPAAATLDSDALARAAVRYKVGAVGEFKANKTGTLDEKNIVHDLVYGLVNVRTDGNRILCATRNESDKTWNVRAIHSRF